MSTSHVAQLRHDAFRFGPLLALMAAIGAAIAVGSGALGRSDQPVALAVLALFLAAAMVAPLGWRQRGNRNGGLTYWDVAGALVFIGIVVSATIDPGDTVRIVKDGAPL